MFTIVANDFDESLLKYKSAPRFHYFKEKGGTYELTRVDYQIGALKKIFRKSAFARYLMLNLQVRRLRNPLSSEAKDPSLQYVGNVPLDVSDERLGDSESAIDEFFHQLPARSGLGTDSILFVVDGMRPNLYSEAGLDYAQDSFHSQMRSYFIMVAERLGYEVRDMQPIFIKRNRDDGSIFEFQQDAHWNQLGHSLVASEIAKSQVYESTFDSPEQ